MVAAWDLTWYQCIPSAYFCRPLSRQRRIIRLHVYKCSFHVRKRTLEINPHLYRNFTLQATFITEPNGYHTANRNRKVNKQHVIPNTGCSISMFSSPTSDLQSFLHPTSFCQKKRALPPNSRVVETVCSVSTSYCWYFLSYFLIKLK